MELFERYLQAVKKHLPWKRQDDILNELRANLESQLEDKESELGRPLTEGEMTDWLRQLGSPLQVAARYQPMQYLIGPSLFPMYWYVLRVAFLWASVIYSIVNVVIIATTVANANAVNNDNAANVAALMAEALVRLPGVLMTVAAWVTLIFAALEFATSRYPSICPPIAGLAPDWSPSSLPPLEKISTSGQRPRSYAHAVAEVVFGYILLIWLILIPRHPFLLLGPGAFYLQSSPFRLAHIFMDFYWVVLALNILQVGWKAWRLWRGTWQQPQSAMHFAEKIFSLIPIALLLTVPEHVYVLLKNPDLDQARYGAAIDSINHNAWRGFAVIFAIIVVQIVGEAARDGLNHYRRRIPDR